MPRSLARDLVATLAASPVAPAALHRAAWAAAIAEGDELSQRRLIARLDAPEDLVAEYATLTRSALRAEYLGRPRMDRGDNPYAGASSTALALAIKRNSSDSALRAAAAATIVERPTAVLARTLVKARIPLAPDAAFATATALVKSADVFMIDDPLVAQLGPERAADLLDLLADSGNVHSVLVAKLLAFPVAYAAVERMFLAWAQDCEARDWLGNPNFVAKRARSMLLHRPREEQGRLLTAILDFPATRSAALAAMPTPEPLLQWCVTGERSDAGTTMGVVTAQDADAGQLRALAATAGSVVLTAVVDRLVATTSHAVWTAAAATTLRNPALTVHDRHRLAQTLRRRELAGEATFVGEEPIAVHEQFPDDDVMSDIWNDVFPAFQLRHLGFAAFGDSLATHATRWAERDPELFAAACELGLPAGTLRALPTTVVDQLLAGPLSVAGVTYHATRTRATLAALLGTLGDQPATWTAFEALRGGFAGTFGDLLSTCEHITA